MFGQAEEVHHVSKPVADQAFGPKHRILISDGQRRVVRTSQPTLVGFLVFDLVERPQPAGGIEFEYLRPTRKALRLTMVDLPAVNTPQFDWARKRLPLRPQPVP